MADKQAQALERLLTKLSAIRKTLRGEERQLLDAMVLAARSEVSAHSSTTKKASAGQANSDMEMHTARPRATPTKILQAEGRAWQSIVLDDGNYKASTL